MTSTACSGFRSAKSNHLNLRNPYRDNPPDFKAIAAEVPSLRPFLRERDGRCTIDFHKEGALRALTKTLLRRDFHLSVEFPPSGLIPTLNSRLEYLLWVDALVEKVPYGVKTVGLDVGVGASCIFPLLGVCIDPGWEFIGTEPDPLSRDYARRNIASNGLEGRITVVDCSPNLLPIHSLPPAVSFVLSNPPFYSDNPDDEVSVAETHVVDKALPPSATTTGTPQERQTAGGSVGFGQKIIQESFYVYTRCAWFTMWLGRKADLAALVDILLGLRVKTILWTTFYHGYTRRWGLAWSHTVNANEVAQRARFRNARRERPLVGADEWGRMQS